MDDATDYIKRYFKLVEDNCSNAGNTTSVKHHLHMMSVHPVCFTHTAAHRMYM